MRIGLLVAFVLLWFLNSPILQRIYNVKDYYGYVDFVATRFKVYEVMFMILAGVCFLSCKGASKAISSFALILIIGSLVDKVFFNVTGYVYGDIFLVMLGLIVSVIVYGRSRLGKSQELNN